MTNLSADYMGLKLNSPIIASSSGLTNSVSKIKKLEESGAGAIVLKSIFEEEINAQAESIKQSGGAINEYWDAADYINNYVKDENIHKYLELITEAKKAVSIPIIASINCSSSGDWTKYAKNIEDAGADALELNIFIIPSRPEQKGEEIEKIYFDIIRRVKKEVTIPLAAKISYHFSGLSNTIVRLSETGIDGLVLFNRFYSPDIDLSKMKIISGDIFSSPEEISIPIRWIAVCSDKVNCDIAASTGIHDGYGALKCILVGAKTVCIASILYKKGPDYISIMLDQMKNWMTDRGYKTLDDFRGKMSQENISDPVAFERAQFMKHFSDHSA